MKDARVEEVEQISDSDSEEKEADSDKLTIGIFPSQSPPTYLLMSTKQEKVSFWADKLVEKFICFWQ